MIRYSCCAADYLTIRNRGKVSDIETVFRCGCRLRKKLFTPSSWTSMWSENIRPHAPPWGNSNSLWLPKLCGLCDCDQDKFTAWFLGQKGGKPRGRLACFCEQILVVGVRPSYWWGLALSVLEVEPTKLTVGKSTKFLSFYVIFKSNTLKLWKRQKRL